jgi:hypothetical protein
MERDAVDWALRGSLGLVAAVLAAMVLTITDMGSFAEQMVRLAGLAGVALLAVGTLMLRRTTGRVAANHRP